MNTSLLLTYFIRQTNKGRRVCGLPTRHLCTSGDPVPTTHWTGGV